MLLAMQGQAAKLYMDKRIQLWYGNSCDKTDGLLFDNLIKKDRPEAGPRDTGLGPSLRDGNERAARKMKRNCAAFCAPRDTKCSIFAGAFP
jgi:hypothetical protein